MKTLKLIALMLAATFCWSQAGATKPTQPATHKGKPATRHVKAETTDYASTPPASTTADQGMSTAPGASRRRDPFINPVAAAHEGGGNSGCTSGKRCLAVNEIVLRGVVKTVSGMIAVVENSAQRTYFLHINDPILNGFVSKITPDSVVFKENYTDNLGRPTQREVVKTVNAPVV
jgi:hypothetical protein